MGKALGTIGRVGAGVMTLGGSEVLGVGDDLQGFLSDPSGANAANDRLLGYQNSSAAQRAAAKAKQYELLGSLKGPQVSDQVRNRIRALETESRPTSLVEDPYFQGQRATLVQGGQQALSSVQNNQKAQGTSGGFSNQGSVNDIYDRLGAQLSQLGQQSANVKSSKADQAAQMQQAIADGQIAFDNAVTNAKIAIESGDAAAASQALQQAYAAREQVVQNQRNFYTGIAQMGLGAVTSNPGMLAGGAGGVANTGQGPTAANANAMAPAAANQNYFSNIMNNGGMSTGGYGATTYKPYYQMR